MRIIFTILSILIFALFANGQQMALHNLYHTNRTLINPAAVGYTDCKVFNFTDKYQWTGIPDAPSIQSISAQFGKQFHKHKKRGVGFNVVRDKNGAEQNIGLEFAYAYHIVFGHKIKHNLSFGLALKAGQYSLDQKGMNIVQVNDPLLRGEYLNLEWYYNASSGVYFYNENYFAGVAVYNLIPRQTSLYSEYGNNTFFTTVLAGYHFRPKNDKFLLKSSVYSALGSDVIQVDLNNHFYFDNSFWAGVTLRKYLGDFAMSGQNVLFFFGYELMENWDIAYAFDLGINRLQPNHFGSHQISIGYKLCRQKYACPTYKK